MEIKLNRKNQLPIHTQLKAQLQHLIQCRQLSPGARLPTVRQLAGFLRINRNTVSKVFSEMEKEGYLTCEPGRGTFVSRPKTESKMRIERMQKLLAVIDQAVGQAKELGFTPEELTLTLFARVQTADKPVQTPRTSAVFIECNRFNVEAFSAELRKELPLRIKPMLIDDFRRQAEKTPTAFNRYDLIITTVFHHDEVKALLAGTGIEVVALLIEMSLDNLMRLTTLPEGTKVCLVCADSRGSENMKLSVEKAGLTHLELAMGCDQKPESLRAMLNDSSVIFCSRLVEEKIKSLAPPGKEIIVQDQRLDEGGIEMLRARLRELDSRDHVTR
ncbi:MAG: GntR family transcriptional regulator [Thermodesulfobacteriota bacterium]